MTNSFLWLTQNTQWYRRIADGAANASATSSVARFAQMLASGEWERAIVQLPLSGPEMQEIARVWQMRGTALPVLVFDPMQTLRAGEFPETWPADWHLLRGSEEQAIRRELEAFLAPPPAPPVEPWRKMLIGDSHSMAEIRELIGLIAPLNSTALITGSTGTGKEVVARAIHMASKRAGKPFVAVNCAALPDTLLEAELFGHTKGAFTGATSARVGLFERADGGTVFLDEIGDMPLELQAKLLRVLQERQIQRLGSSDVIPVNVRIITATNADLKQLCALKQFRQDLYFRLNVVPVKMPLLRDRPEDVVPLLNHFLAKIAHDEDLPLKRISEDAQARLQAYSWPGNVRELEHAVERAIAVTGTRMLLRFEDFALDEISAFDAPHMGGELDIPDSGFNFEAALQQFQIAMIEVAMRKSGGNKQRAADMLGLKRTTMISKFKSLEYTV